MGPEREQIVRGISIKSRGGEYKIAGGRVSRPITKLYTKVYGVYVYIYRVSKTDRIIKQTGRKTIPNKKKKKTYYAEINILS